MLREIEQTEHPSYASVNQLSSGLIRVLCSDWSGLSSFAIGLSGEISEWGNETNLNQSLLSLEMAFLETSDSLNEKGNL